MDKKTIKYFLDLANVRQKDIAEQLGVSPAVVSMTISGIRKQRAVQVKVAAALGRKVEDIFPDGKGKVTKAA